MTLNISFNEIAHAYEAQRAHPPEVAAQVGRAIAGVAGDGALVLELGVGTGRIALPAAQAGLRVIGIDLAREMLAVAQGRAGAANLPGPAPALIQGDVARLPLREGLFDAVLAVHILHLVPDWRGALVEAVRVLRPGGVFIQGRDWRDPQSCAERLRARLREAVMELLPGARPPGAGAAIGQALAHLGGTPAPEQVAAEWQTEASPATLLAGMAARADAETWALDDALLEAAMGRVRSWAASEWPDLDAPQAIAQRFVLSVVRF
ncbi:MAG: class I SAM-dependent methyltransferase [Roseiflexaceae bacterium]